MKSSPPSYKSSQQKNITRRVLLFICTHSLKLVLARERSSSALERREHLLSEFYTALVEFYTKEAFRVFHPCGFPEKNICVLVFLCFCACFSFSDLLVTNYFKISSKQF